MAPASLATQLPPLLTESTQVLVSHIPLPPLSSIVYAKFIPRPQQLQPHRIIELARQRIVNDVRQCVTDSLLPIVRIRKDTAALWVFAIHSGANDHEHQAIGEQPEIPPLIAAKRLEALDFDGLERCQLSHFTPSTLYPCSSQCAVLPTPCSSCTRTSSDSSVAWTQTPTSSSAATLLPRLPLRPIYQLFVDAVRDRLISDICAASNKAAESRVSIADPQGQSSGHTPHATRLGNGFLSCAGDTLPAWGVGWEHRSRKRPLVHTALDVHLSPTALHIRPLPTTTTLLPIPISLSPMLPSQASTTPATPGTPLILAPYPTPAFYISTHAKTSIPSSLLTQFWDALAGLGAPSLSSRTRSFPPRSTSSSPNPKSSPPRVLSQTSGQDAFILVFIPLTNTQGEPKGITALWPAHLAFVDTSPSRFHLTNLPEMPGTEMLLTPPRGSGVPTQMSLSASPSPRNRRRSAGHGLSRANRTQRAFRTLELSSYKRVIGVPVPGTAKHAAGYVESVAKEREKEREKANQERARRERETKEGKAPASGSSSTLAHPVNSVPQVAQSSGGPDVAILSTSKVIAGMGRSALSTNSIFSNFFTKAAQGNEANSFYPSPPDWDPVASTSTSGEAQALGHVPPSTSTSPSAGVHSLSAEQPQARPNVPRTIGNNLNGMNLGMDMDMTNMGINLNDTMGMMGVNMTIGLDPTEMMGGGFGSFTDNFTEDDFNFFDATPPVGAMPDVMQDMQDSLHHLGTSDDAVNGWLTNGLAQDTTPGMPHHHNTTIMLQPGSPNSVGVHASASLLPQTVNDIQMSEDDAELLPPAPDLMPSSPAKSPWSPGNPQTPSLELNVLQPPAVGRAMFEPIPFGESHHLADGKYRGAAGKFAFTHMTPTSAPQSYFIPGDPDFPHEKKDGWKCRYVAATDPRVGVVNRLRGVKRKLPQNSHSPKSVKDRARDEEWETLYDDDEDVDTPDSSSSEEDDDAEEFELGQEHDDDSSSFSRPSRPSTPPPPGLPLTASLLYTHFHHAHLLPLGVPIRPSYNDLVPDHGPPPVPISVPTPVSPAAALGSAAERSKTLELLAQAVAKEAVENDAWAEAWALSPDASSTGPTVKMGLGVTQADLRQVSDLMDKVDGLKGPLHLSNLLEPPSPARSSASDEQPSPVHGNKLQLMHPPWLSVGRAGLVHQMLPPAIRFWEKEGLGPRGGTKDVVAFALFEEGHERSVLVENWLERVSRAYTARGFGAHVAGKAEAFESGLVPLQFEAVRKTFPNLMSALPPEPQHIVIYVIAPPSVCSSLKSPALRTIIMNQKRISKLAGQHDFDQDRVLVHFVPDYLVVDPHTYPNTQHVGLERFVVSIYDRLLRPTLRQMSRQFWKCNPPFENRFQVPAYVLARKTPQTYLEWDERPSLNVLDRHTFLQVGYRVSQCGKWLLAACIDERGEAHDVAVWSVPTQSESATTGWNWVVSNIWIFAKQFAQRADTEWRIVVTKLGEMQESEVEVWVSHLETVGSAHPGPPVHVSLVCAQNNMPLPFLWPPDVAKNPLPNTPPDPNSVFADVSSTTYSAFFPQRTPIISPSLLCLSHHSTMVSPVASEEDVDQPSSPKASVGILPLCTTALFDVPNDTDVSTVSTLYIHLLYAYKSAKSTLKKTTHEVHADITRNWHELAVLTRERWHFAQHKDLPFHLAALEVMSDVLDPLTLAPDAKEIEYLGG